MTVPLDPADNTVTLGEVYRTLDRFRTETDRRFSDLDKKVVGFDLYTVSHKALEQRVEDLEKEAISTRNWHRNLSIGVLGTLATAVSTLVLLLAHIR